MGGGPDHEHLLITLPIPETKLAAEVKTLRTNHPTLTITYHECHDPSAPTALYAPATIIVTLFALPPADEPLQTTCPHLHLVHFFSAGINRAVSHPLYTHTSIPLTTSSGVHGPQIAEWVTMTELVQRRKYNALHELQKAHRWGTHGPRNDLDLMSVRDGVGMRVGVLGYGAIGRQVGRVCQAMGMNVVAYTASSRDTAEKRRETDKYIVPSTGDAEGAVPVEWYSGTETGDVRKFLGADLDWVVVCVPLTATRHLLGKEEFKVLGKRRAFVTNISRGDILEQDEFVEALKPRKDEQPSLLRGAALDVTTPEPLPADNPLWDLENCTITPHISGMGSAYAERSFQILDINLGLMEKKKRLLNVVDRRRGY